MLFRSTLNETNYIITQESDGILGLNNDVNSFINRLYKSKVIPNNIFSICLNHNNSGYFSLGELFTSDHLSNKINYIPFTIDEEEKYYKIKIDSFEIGDRKIDFQTQAIIDTTASLTSFPSYLFNLIEKELNTKCSKDACGKLVKNKNFGLCGIFKNETNLINSIMNWPDIIINFGNYKFNWKSENYYVDLSSENYKRVCLGFESTDEDIITLGTTFLHGNDVIFDRKKKEIGIVESKCQADFNFADLTTVNSNNSESINITNLNSNIEAKINEIRDKKRGNEYSEIKNHPAIGEHILSSATIFKDIIPI